MKFISTICIGIGLLFSLYSFFLVWERFNPRRLAFDYSPPIVQDTVNYYPIRILIPAIEVDLPVIQSSIRDNQWETTSKGISYLRSTPVPGEKGNSILYGHNWTNLLAQLPEVYPGNVISIEFNTGQTKEFIVNATGVVTPEDTHVLYPSSDTRITLYSCTGFLDRERFVVTAIAQNNYSSDRKLPIEGRINDQ